jgi:N-methylhydantoinase B
MGANAVGHEHMRALVAKYGADMVKAVMKRQMNDAERQLRAKLRQIPDGSWSAVNYQEQSRQDDRGLYKIALTLRKQDDHLIFDFTGTDPQSGMINCTYGGMHGGVVSALLPTLCGDIPWAAGGILRCLDIVSEEGTLNNCTFPAAIGKASVASGWATIDVAMECVSKMIDTHPTYRQRTTSVCCGTWDLAVVAGLDKSGQPFAAMFTDSMGGGYGAGVDHDGVDTAGQVMIPMGKMPDVEMHEFMLPVLYLWRREECDSGGPGKFRGGLSASLCLISYETATPMTLVVSGSGKAVPMNVGLAGGYPGNTQVDLTIRHTNVMDLFAQGGMPARLEEIQGEYQFQPCEVESSIGPGDVHYMYWQAGGGYGDPLLRDPLAVQRDVEEGKVSLMAARTLYGVILDQATYMVDAAATASTREALLNQRKERAAQGAK